MIIVCFYIFTVAPSSTKPQKNVILIVLDTVRADRLGCYGNTYGITPEIDSFAQESVLFENAFSHAPWTLPSIASLLTSSHPAQHGASGFLGSFTTLKPDAVTLAEVFRSAGAETGAITNVFFLSEKFGMTQGFKTTDAYTSHSNRDTRRAGPTTSSALRWIDLHKNKPFFLFLHYFDPHLVYDPPQPFRRQFADSPDCNTTDFIFGTVNDMSQLRRNQTAPSPDIVDRLEKLHNGEVAYTDSEVGKLIEGISQRGLDQNTIIVITSDHGEEFLDHGGFEHGHTLYNELLHVPLIIRDPNTMSNRYHSDSSQNCPVRLSPTIRLIDVAPTICELASVAVHPAFVGRSLVPFLRGQHQADRPVFSQGNMWGPGGTSLRKDGLKIIVQSS
ncbi:MAG: sulfatase, partial [Planctomycetota bacterium]